MKEEYRVIEEYERYSVSNLGNVKNNITNRVLSKRLNSKGYYRVNLRTGLVKYEKPHSVEIHKLVGRAFLPRIEGKNYLNHKDLNKLNNRVDNLEWCTLKENSQHAYTNKEGLKEKYLVSLAKAHANQFKFVKVYLNNEYLGVFKGVHDTAKKFNVSVKTILNSSKGMNNRKGYKFIILKEVV